MEDHQHFNPDLELYTSSPLVGSGLPIWLPGGALVRQSLEEYARSSERRQGYSHVYSPVLAKRELYEISGHWGHYRDSMFSPIADGDEELVLRPMNCPHHALAFAAAGKSYRQLPFRVAELAPMFRQEQSGSLNGLSRVRAMTLADAHIFLMPEQVQAEVVKILGEVQEAYSHLGIEPVRVRLSLRGEGEKYVADDALWGRAEAGLRAALDASGLEYEEAAGEAAFYGPKIDVQVRSAHGQEETLSTIQLDFHLPERFDLSYRNRDGDDVRPVMVHRSVLSTMERMTAFLVEHHQGRLPAWLAPVAVAVLPVSEEVDAYAQEVCDALLASGVRAEVRHDGPLGGRIRGARLVPVVAVIGERERDSRTVSPRVGRKNKDAMDLAEFVSRLVDNVQGRSPQSPF